MNCDICNDNLWLEGDKLSTCQNCGFVRASDRYYFQNLDDIYNPSYYYQGDYFDYTVEEKALRKNFKNRIKHIRKYIKSGDLLEVGCAYGFFLDEARCYFNVAGVERDPETAKKTAESLGVKVFGGDFLSFNSKKKYDAVVALDVIEHLKSPRSFVLKCFDLLKPGGYLFIETGDIGAFLPKIKKEKWRLVYPPVHLTYLSKETISRVLKENGFDVEKVIRVWFWRSLIQTLFKISPVKFKSNNSLLSKLFRKIIFPANTFDLILVVAKKSESI